MPKNEYNELLSQCDVGIVSLNAKLMMPNIPSKTIGLFNLSKPILAAIDYSTDYGKLLEESGGGLWSYSGDTEAFRRNILKLYNDRELVNKMGESGHNYYQKYFTPSSSYQTIMNHIK
jgi:glycosyltransferase involved in cell wall biosynthesis